MAVERSQKMKRFRMLLEPVLEPHRNRKPLVKNFSKV